MSSRQAAGGWFAKGGAEGLLCAGGPAGIGLAIKAEDGSSRPLGPALAAFLAVLGVGVPGLATLPTASSRDEGAGEVSIATS